MLDNYFKKHILANHNNWKRDLIAVIHNFNKQFGVFPSYILANDYTHSLIDLWTNHLSKNDSKLTHFIIDGNYIHLVFDNQISDNELGLQYDSFFELEKGTSVKLPVRKKKKHSISKH